MHRGPHSCLVGDFVGKGDDVFEFVQLEVAELLQNAIFILKQNILLFLTLLAATISICMFSFQGLGTG